MIAVFGASGRLGSALCRELAARGLPHRPVVRDAARWAVQGLAAEPRIADAEDAPALREALEGATRVASCAHARHTAALLAAAPPGASFSLTGSTRRHSRWPDAHGDGTRAGEAAFLASGRDGVLLHPTMIYGEAGEDNVQRLAALLRRLPVAPLPGGGRALVQPVHLDDVVACHLAVLTRDWRGPHVVTVAGPEAMPYAEFAAAVARAAGVRMPRVVALPGGLLRALAPASRLVPGLPRVTPDEVRRLLEDKAFDVGPMRERLGVEPVPLDVGLARTFRAAQRSA